MKNSFNKRSMPILASLCLSAALAASLPAVAADAPTSGEVAGSCVVVMFTNDSKLQDVVEMCDAAIAANRQGNPFQHLNRGTARYYQLRADPTPSATPPSAWAAVRTSPLAVTLANAGSVPATDLRAALADLQLFVDADVPASQDGLDGAWFRLGELTAVSAARDGKPELYDVALKHLAKADALARKYEQPENVLFKAVFDARIAIYKMYLDIFNQRENDYRGKGMAFQQAMQAQQAAPSQDTAPLCGQLSAMNASYQASKAAFGKLSGMKDRGELGSNPAMIAKIDARLAQQVQVQANIDATATRLACK